MEGLSASRNGIDEEINTVLTSKQHSRGSEEEQEQEQGTYPPTPTTHGAASYHSCRSASTAEELRAERHKQGKKKATAQTNTKMRREYGDDRGMTSLQKCRGDLCNRPSCTHVHQTTRHNTPCWCPGSICRGRTSQSRGSRCSGWSCPLLLPPAASALSKRTRRAEKACAIVDTFETRRRGLFCTGLYRGSTASKLLRSYATVHGVQIHITPHTPFFGVHCQVLDCRKRRTIGARLNMHALRTVSLVLFMPMLC